MKPYSLITSLLVAAVLAGAADSPKRAVPAKKRAPNPAFAQVTDDPKLPRVLLIGDSISIGYTLDVRKLLAGKANVHRIPMNGGPTKTGLEKLTTWLGSGKWDVIHFNWGLHDLKFMEDGTQQVPPADYEKNLRTLVGQLKATGAKLIWCATTPVPDGDLKPKRKNTDVIAYNAIAKKIMNENGVAIDDLYTFAMPQLQKIQRPVNVHFTDEGSVVLAKQVVACIGAALPKPTTQ